MIKTIIIIIIIIIIVKYKLPPSAFTPAKQVQWNPFEQTKKSVRENLRFQLHQIFIVKNEHVPFTKKTK